MDWSPQNRSVCRGDRSPQSILATEKGGRVCQTSRLNRSRYRRPWPLRGCVDCFHKETNADLDQNPAQRHPWSKELSPRKHRAPAWSSSDDLQLPPFPADISAEQVVQQRKEWSPPTDTNCWYHQFSGKKHNVNVTVRSRSVEANQNRRRGLSCPPHGNRCIHIKGHGDSGAVAVQPDKKASMVLVVLLVLITSRDSSPHGGEEHHNHPRRE